LNHPRARGGSFVKKKKSLAEKTVSYRKLSVEIRCEKRAAPLREKGRIMIGTLAVQKNPEARSADNTHNHLLRCKKAVRAWEWGEGGELIGARQAFCRKRKKKPATAKRRPERKGQHTFGGGLGNSIDAENVVPPNGNGHKNGGGAWTCLTAGIPRKIVGTKTSPLFKRQKAVVKKGEFVLITGKARFFLGPPGDPAPRKRRGRFTVKVRRKSKTGGIGE